MSPWDPLREELAELWALVRQLGADLAALGASLRRLAARVDELERRQWHDE